MQLSLIFAKITVTYPESDITTVRVLRRELELVAFVRTHPNLVFLWHKGYHGNCRLAAPINFIKGISTGKLDSFRLDFVPMSDESGPVINDYL